jgi:hypothetical protein
MLPELCFGIGNDPSVAEFVFAVPESNRLQSWPGEIGVIRDQE